MRFSTTILHTFSGLATVALVSLDDVESNFRSENACTKCYNFSCMIKIINMQTDFWFGKVHEGLGGGMHFLDENHNLVFGD